MTIAHNHFYTGHGMSIGSNTDGGASTIRVSDLSIDGADNGLRVKSNITRGGLVEDVVYEGVCIRDTANPIVTDTSYTAHVSAADNRFPIFRGITLRNVRIHGGGKVTLEGVDAQHKTEIRFDNVTFDDPGAIRTAGKHVVAKGYPLKFTGDDVVSDPAGSSPAAGNACADKFVPFPLR